MISSNLSIYLSIDLPLVALIPSRWCLLCVLGPEICGFSVALGLRGACWEASGVTFCHSWAALGSLFGTFGPPLTALRPLLGAPGPLWAALGPLLTFLGPILGVPGPLLAALGPLLGGSWAALGRSWAALGRAWEQRLHAHARARPCVRFFRGKTHMHMHMRARPYSSQLASD